MSAISWVLVAIAAAQALAAIVLSIAFTRR
jgi:hypothetical protein